MDLDHGRAMGTDRTDIILTGLPAWIEDKTGHKPRDAGLFERALTHSSRDAAHYERLEFLGDRVLGLIMARWLFELFPDEPEGNLSSRLNVLVSRANCAQTARAMDLAARMRLGKQAQDDGAHESDNVLGDMVEALIGALYLEGGLDAAETFVRRWWQDRVTEQEKAPKHPKSMLQEWAAAKGRRPPVYELVERSGPHHSPRFVIEVTIGGLASVRAEGTSKQEAETEAARIMLEKLT